MTGTRRPRPDTMTEVLDRYPRLTAHMVCESLGYFTPHAAANALLHHIRGEPFACEWYVHMARGFSDVRLREVDGEVVQLAFAGRHRHRGPMAGYPQARALVERVRRGGEGPVLASWF